MFIRNANLNKFGKNFVLELKFKVTTIVKFILINLIIGIL